MKKDLDSYLKVYNVLSNEVCDSIVSQIKNHDWRQHSYYNYADNTFNSHDRDLSINSAEVEETKMLYDVLWKTIHQYISELNFRWYSGWNGFTQIRWNRYDVGTVMNEHCDHIHSIFDGQRKGVPTLTVLGMLNDDYKGGELVMYGGEVIECKKGDVFIFPSNFLYPHRVDEVTEGTRFSFVSWVW